MKTLAFDGRMGAAGDMILAALLAAGADSDALAPVEESEALSVRYAIGETEKNGILATTVDVLLEGEEGHDHAHDDGDHEHPHAHGHDEDHHHSHDDEDHGHTHSHDHHPDHAEGHGPHRSYPEVLDIVSGMGLPESVEADAKAVFRILGEAESEVHGTDLEDTHFHEVGADDAIADVVGAALLFADLELDRIVTTPVSAGDGEVAMSHGTYPIPAPAVVNVAARASWDLQGGPVEAELLTPTGAAILAHFAEGVETLPPLRVERVGYGAGGWDFPDRPNVLRATLGASEGSLATEDIRVLETNLDDATPETLGALQETLKTAGARDVSVLPATMKKSRPGHLVKVIVRPEDVERVARRLAEETGTLGVRDSGARHRWVAERRYETVTLDVEGERFEVTAKVASDADGAVYDVSAEHDDALAVAQETGLAVRDVRRRAEAAAREGGALEESLLHVVDAEDWDARRSNGEYRPPSLDAQGFVHLSPADAVLAVAQYNHAGDVEPLLVVVDRTRLDDVRYEESDGGAFPHLYGPLPVDAVTDVFAFPREEGRFVLPTELRD